MSGLSQSKRDKIERARRIREVNARSLDGEGYFMDAGWEHSAQKYVDTGDERYLENLPPRRNT